MALLDNTHYVDSVGYAAVAAWAANTAIAAGALRRQNSTPSVGNERVFICIVAGTTHATTEPTWTVTRGAKNTDNTVTWQECTGLAGVNGDITNTPTWDQYRATGASGTLGQVIKNNAGTHLFIMSTAGTISGVGSQPTFNTTTGNTTADNAATWTCIGAVGSFTGNQAPHARLANALATNWGAAGNDIYLKSSHAETQATSITLTGASTIALPQRWLCHNGAAYPPVGANVTIGATITSSSGSITGTPLGVYMEGIEFAATANSQGVTFGTASQRIKSKNCRYTRAGTGGSIVFGNTGSGNLPIIELENPIFSFGNIGNTMGVDRGTIRWKGGSLAGAAVPTTLISQGASPSHLNFLVEGFDFSTLGSGKTIVGSMSNISGLIRFINCKLGASVTPAATPGTAFYRVEFINCDSGSGGYRTEVYDFAGTLTTETTIVLTGGANQSGQALSWKIVTTANASFIEPFVSPVIRKWNSGVGAQKTLTIQGIWGGGAVPTDEDIWVEVQYLGASGDPKASFISDAKASVLTTAAAQGAGAGTWGGSTTKFKLEVQFTPQMAGYVRAKVVCGRPSATFYVDPNITLS